MVVNIATGNSIKLTRIIKFLKKYFKKKQIIYDKKKPSMVPIRRINISKFKKFTGYKIKFSIEKGLEETIKWYINKY